MVPITIISGTLGAGKTTLILNLIKQLPESYKSVWLKNEYGDVNVDTNLINKSNIKTKEILNGCLCCVLIGRLKDAITEIVAEHNPDRIIIETAGTSYPYPILEEISNIQGVNIDGFINVVDVLNFEKLADKSALAKSQAKYFDLIVFNKHEIATVEQIEKVEDEVYEIYSAIPKIKSANGIVDRDLMLGIDPISKSFSKSDYVEHTTHIHEDFDIFNLELRNITTKEKFIDFIKTLNPNDFYRIKGIMEFEKKEYIFNYVLGRYTLDEVKTDKNAAINKLIFIGAKGISSLKKNITDNLSR